MDTYPIKLTYHVRSYYFGEAHVEPSHPERCITLSNVGESVRLEYAGGTESLGRAESCVLPATIGEVNVVPKGPVRRA